MTPANAKSIAARLITTGTAAFSVSLAVNACTTALIVYRILMMSKQLASGPAMGNTQKNIRTAIAAIIESGVLTFVFQFAWTLLFSLDRHPGFYMVGGSTTMIYVGFLLVVRWLQFFLSKYYAPRASLRPSSLFVFRSAHPLILTLRPHKGAVSLSCLLRIKPEPRLDSLASTRSTTIIQTVSSSSWKRTEMIGS
jgi:hypothetical protein